GNWVDRERVGSRGSINGGQRGLSSGVGASKDLCSEFNVIRPRDEGTPNGNEAVEIIRGQGGMHSERESATRGAINAKLAAVRRNVVGEELAVDAFRGTVLAKAAPDDEKVGTDGTDLRQELITVGSGVYELSGTRG